jgi:predicted RNA binding protein YcfA (HicA-like mRNA interferase family)
MQNLYGDFYIINNQLKVINLIPLYFEIKRTVAVAEDRRMVFCAEKGSHVIMEHPAKKGQIVCPYHGSQEIGKGLERKIKKDAGIK